VASLLKSLNSVKLYTLIVRFVNKVILNKVKYISLTVVVLVVGPISTAAMKAYCTLTPTMEFRHSSPEALNTKRRERPLLAKDGTKAKEFS
jgi:hypothetical protein